MNKTLRLKALALPILFVAMNVTTAAALAAESATATTAVVTTAVVTSNTSSKPSAEVERGKSEENKSRVQNGKGAIQGNLETSQHIYYVGDALDIKVQFARGADLLAKGEADAHIVIFSFDGTVSSVPVPADVGTSSRKFFPIKSIDIATLPAGQYQLALVLTKPKGDPKLVSNWYSGFRALMDSEAIYISATCVSGDANKDGEWDDDSDGDGIVGEEDDDKGMQRKKK
jgi:hypothetical protein